MAKISQLPALANPTGDEPVPVISGGKAYCAPLSALATAAVQPKVNEARDSALVAQQAMIANLSSADLRAAPRDPVGLWAIDRYDAANRYIPNLAAASLVPSANLKRASRRAFNSLFYYRNNVIAIDKAAVGLSGKKDASFVTGTGNWLLALGDNQGTIPAGTYTIACNIMRKAASDQQFAFTKDSGATRSAALNATGVFQRFSYTFTVGATTNFAIGLCSIDGATSAALIVDNIELFAGAVDPGPVSPTGHIYLGKSHAQAAAPNYAAGVLSSAPANVGSIQFPTRYGFARWSHSMLVEQTGIGATSPLLWDINDFSNYASQVAAASTAPAGSPMSAAGNAIMNNLVAGQNGQGQRGGLFNLIGKGFHLLTRTYDGVAEELWLDDIRLFRHERTLTARNLQDYVAFADPNGNGPQVNVAGQMGLWDRALTPGEIRNWFSYQRQRYPNLNIPGLRGLRILVVEGDSNHGGQSQTCWIWLFTSNDNPENIGSVWATVGARLDRATDGLVNVGSAALTDRAAMLDATIPPDTYDRQFILTVGIGTNDLGVYPGGAAAYITALRAYCMARKKAGWTVLLHTPLPNSNATFLARRATLVADIRANWALYGLDSASRVIDWAADPYIGTDTSQADYPANWADGLHLSPAGNAIAETYGRAAINQI